jgi:hypothetical protein
MNLFSPIIMWSVAYWAWTDCILAPLRALQTPITWRL